MYYIYINTQHIYIYTDICIYTVYMCIYTDIYIHIFVYIYVLHIYTVHGITLQVTVDIDSRSSLHRVTTLRSQYILYIFTSICNCMLYIYYIFSTRDKPTSDSQYRPTPARTFLRAMSTLRSQAEQWHRVRARMRLRRLGSRRLRRGLKVTR